jgi:ATP-binding cassette subfamily B protein
VNIGSNLLRELLAQRLERETRQEFYLNLLGKSQSFHDRQRIGDLMARAAEDVRTINFLISPALSLIFEAFFNMIIPIILIYMYYPLELLIIPIIFSISFIVNLRSYLHRLEPISQKNREEFGMMDAVLNETLTGIDLIKALASENNEKQKYTVHMSKFREAIIAEGKVQAKYLPLVLIAIATTTALLQALSLLQAGKLEIGQVISFVGLMINLRFPTYISIWAFSIVRQALSGAERLLNTMNSKSEIDLNPTGKSKILDGKILFKNIIFTYPGAQLPVLKNISLEITPGQTVAIVGTTGSGKTTLTKLISRLYDISEGQILLDDIPLKEYNLESIRSQISYIEQDIFLFSKSIKENIDFGHKSSMDQIITAAKNAQAHDFIMNLPEKYETKLGEEGVQLSGGERQRIAIARAFLTNPRILILDDSTSAIDSVTEEQIQNAIKAILRGRTTLLITHRLSQIRWADKIVVMKRGEVIAQGTHTELLNSSEEYRKIFVKRFDLSAEQLQRLENSTKKAGGLK